VIPMLIEKDDYLVTTDISKAYYCVPIHESIQKYFCFEHEGLIICPKILVFGLNEAPFFFNKIMREMMKFFRKLGIKMSSYFDDQIWAAKNREEAERLVKIILCLMTNLGWLINEKAILEPSQVAEHIGWQIRTKSMTIHRAPKKIEESND